MVQPTFLLANRPNKQQATMNSPPVRGYKCSEGLLCTPFTAHVSPPQTFCCGNNTMTVCKQTQTKTNNCNLIPTFLSWNGRKWVKERNIRNDVSNNHNEECFSFALRSQKLHVCLVSPHTSLTVLQWILHYTWLCQFMQITQWKESDNIAVSTTSHLPCEFTQQLITKKSCNRLESDKIILTEYHVCLSQSTSS